MYDFDGVLLSWTKELPTQPGYYWAYASEILYFVEVLESMEVYNGYGGADFKLNDYSYWLGPIPEPKKPE